MRNRLRVRGPRPDLLIETEWFFRTYDAPQARRLFRRAGFEPVAVYDFDYCLDAPLGRGSPRLDRVWVLRPASSPSGRESAHPKRVERRIRRP
jgi:hypothetical protein